MKKIIVIGCPGSGKSTFAKKLHEKTSIPLYHLDLIWHRPDKTTVSRESFDAELSKILMSDAWIIDGNYSRTLGMRFEKCDTVFLLDLPLEDCLSGVESRIGKKRSDLPWVESDFDDEFKKWILDFPKECLPKIYSMIESYRGRKNITVFKSRNEADCFIADLN